MPGAEPSRRFAVAILPVLLVAWVARLEYIVILPSYAYSWDISSWQEVAGLLGSGTNPYAATTFLNWPPLWMLCLFVLGRVAELGSMQFIDVLRGFLIAAESIGILRQMVLLAGLILLAIPTLGPGFGPQYAFWFIPPLAVSYLSGSTRWKVMLAAAYLVSAATYIVLYGFARDLGGALVYLWWSPVAQSLGVTITRDGPRAWLTLPMFVTWVALLVVGIRELRAPAAATEAAAE